MEENNWSDLVDEEDLETGMFSAEQIAELLQDSSAGCLYCQLSELDADE